MQEDLFFSQVNIVKQISVSLPLPLWHFQQFSQQFVLLSLPLHLSTTAFNLHLRLSFSHTVRMCGAEVGQELPAHCSGTGGRLTARHAPVFWRRRQETPSLMAGDSNLLGRRGEDISLCISSPACVQGNYHSWHPWELNIQSTWPPITKDLLSAKPSSQQMERERIRA